MIKDRVSDREAREAFNLYVKATGKSMEDTLNRAAGNAAYYSIKEMPISRLESLHPHNPSPDNKIGDSKERRLFYALAVRDHGARKGQGVRRAAIKIYGGRKRAKGFVGAIFIKMAKDFGRRVTRKMGQGPTTLESIGYRASAAHLVAAMESGMVDVEVTKLLYTAFDKGLRKALYGPRNMVEYALKQLAKQDAKHGARKR